MSGILYNFTMEVILRMLLYCYIDFLTRTIFSRPAHKRYLTRCQELSQLCSTIAFTFFSYSRLFS